MKEDEPSQPPWLFTTAEYDVKGMTPLTHTYKSRKARRRAKISLYVVLSA